MKCDGYPASSGLFVRSVIALYGKFMLYVVPAARSDVGVMVSWLLVLVFVIATKAPFNGPEA